jgi:hypothetical protein
MLSGRHYGFLKPTVPLFVDESAASPYTQRAIIHRLTKWIPYTKTTTLPYRDDAHECHDDAKDDAVDGACVP